MSCQKNHSNQTTNKLNSYRFNHTHTDSVLHYATDSQFQQITTTRLHNEGAVLCEGPHPRLRTALENTQRTRSGQMRPTRPAAAATGLSWWRAGARCRTQNEPTVTINNCCLYSNVSTPCRSCCLSVQSSNTGYSGKTLPLLSSRLGTDVWIWLDGGRDPEWGSVIALGQSEERKSKRIIAAANGSRPRVCLIHAQGRLMRRGWIIRGGNHCKMDKSLISVFLNVCESKLNVTEKHICSSLRILSWNGLK